MCSYFLALDLGSTHLKAGVFSANGQLLGLSSQINRLHPDSFAGQVYHPQELFHSTLIIIEDALTMAENQIGKDISLSGIGIASMAESGLLVDASTGAERTPILPWFDQRSQPHAQRLHQEAGDATERFRPVASAQLSSAAWRNCCGSGASA